MIPTSIMEVYSGAALSSIEDISKGEKSVMSSALLGVGLLVTIIVSIVITVWVRRKLKAEMDRYAPVSEDEEEEEEEEEDVGAIKLGKLDASDESETERDAAAAAAATTSTQPDVSLSVDGGNKCEESKEALPTASDLEAEAHSVSVSPTPNVAPVASPTQRRSRQSSPNGSPARVGVVASSSAAPVHLTLRTASFSSSAPSLTSATVPHFSPKLCSNPPLTRTRSNSSSNSSLSSGGSSAGADDAQQEEMKLIKHS